MLTIDQIKNFSKGIMLQGYDSAATTVSLIPNGGAAFPDPTSGAYNVVWWNNTDYQDPADDPQVEIVRVVAGAGDVKTILRAQEGTAATDKNTPNKTYKMVLSLTTKMIYDIINQAGTGSVTGGANEGAGTFSVFDAGTSTASTLKFKTISAGANVVITEVAGVLTISATGGGGGGIIAGANVGGGTGQVFRDITGGTTMNFKTLVAGANVTITNNADTITIAASGSGGGGYDTIENNGTPVTSRSTINLSTLLTAADVATKTALTINTANLAADSSFITAITSNATFQSLVNNFITSGGGGGTLIKSQKNGNAVPIVGGTLGTENVVEFEIVLKKSGGTNVSSSVVVQYGGQTIGNITFTQGGTTNGLAYLKGYIFGDGATGNQHGHVFGALQWTSNAPLTLALDDHNDLTVDSTVNQDLTVGITNGLAGILAVDSMIVRSVSKTGSGNALSDTFTAGVTFTGASAAQAAVIGDGSVLTSVLAGGVAGGDTAHLAVDITSLGGAIPCTGAINYYAQSGTPVSGVKCSLQTDNAGSPSGTILASDIKFPDNTAGFLVQWSWAAVSLAHGTKYWLVWESVDPGEASDYPVQHTSGTVTSVQSTRYNGSAWVASGYNMNAGLVATYAAGKLYGATSSSNYYRSQTAGSVVGGTISTPSLLQACDGIVNTSVSIGSSIVMYSDGYPTVAALTPGANYFVGASSALSSSGSIKVGRALASGTSFYIRRY